MNYYEHHIGDYDSATAHLSLVEDGVYGRLLRVYYRTESPLPADTVQVCRLVRATGRPERAVVESILKEFFELLSDGWHNERADEEIARYRDKQAKAKRSANARWNAQRSDSDGNADAMRTHSEGNAHHTPDTNHQSPVLLGELSTSTTHPASYGAGEGVGGSLTPAGEAAAALRRAGCSVTSMNPNLLAALSEGVSVEHLLQVHALYPDKGAGYVIATARREHKEPAKRVASDTARPAAPRPVAGNSPEVKETPQTRVAAERAFCRQQVELGLMEPEVAQQRIADLAAKLGVPV